jgi:hypothetical protein
MQREMFIRPPKQPRSVPCPEIAFYTVPGKRGNLKRVYIEPVPPRIDNRVWESVSAVITAIAKRKLNKSFVNQALYESRQYELAISLFRWLTRDFPASAPLDNSPLSALVENGGHRNLVVRRLKFGKESKGLLTSELAPSTYLSAMPSKIPLGQRSTLAPKTLANKPALGMARSMGVPAPSRIKARKIDKVDYYAPIVSPDAVKIQGKR